MKRHSPTITTMKILNKLTACQGKWAWETPYIYIYIYKGVLVQHIQIYHNPWFLNTFMQWRIRVVDFESGPPPHRHSKYYSIVSKNIYLMFIQIKMVYFIGPLWNISGYMLSCHKPINYTIILFDIVFIINKQVV